MLRQQQSTHTCYVFAHQEKQLFPCGARWEQIPLQFRPEFPIPRLMSPPPFPSFGCLLSISVPNALLSQKGFERCSQREKHTLIQSKRCPSEEGHWNKRGCRGVPVSRDCKPAATAQGCSLLGSRWGIQGCWTTRTEMLSTTWTMEHKNSVACSTLRWRNGCKQQFWCV